LRYAFKFNRQQKPSCTAGLPENIIKQENISDIHDTLAFAENCT